MSTPDAKDYPHLSTLIGGYLHQDMDLEHDSMAEAIADFAAKATPDERAGVKDDLDRLGRARNAEPDAFQALYGNDVDLDAMEVSFDGFAEMIVRILDDPAAVADFDI